MESGQSVLCNRTDFLLLPMGSPINKLPRENGGGGARFYSRKGSVERTGEPRLYDRLTQTDVLFDGALVACLVNDAGFRVFKVTM